LNQDLDPLVQERLQVDWCDTKLQLLTAHSLFSSARIDGGTRLLLDHLPAGEPGAFLDLGCGYGALGLPVAARFPRARGLLVDRDLLAVEFSRRNAVAARLPNVEVRASLGYSDLSEEWRGFDWILCNMPARAGERVVESLLSGGRSRLLPGGQMRIVIIAPLASMLERVALKQGFVFEQVVASGQHVVFAFPAVAGSPEQGVVDDRAVDDQGADDSYVRDTVELAFAGLAEPLCLKRPTDLADEPHRLRDAMPLLAESLPQDPPRRAFVFRCGYGLAPALLLARYQNAQVIAADRDLLGTRFTRLNCSAAGERLCVQECVGLPRAPAGDPVDLIVGELLPPLGREATLAELRVALHRLAPGGRALVLGLAKQWREFLEVRASDLYIVRRRVRGSAALYEMQK
jgi:16S rRNA (guanine1207-N2)-methyltransferase